MTSRMRLVRSPAHHYSGLLQLSVRLRVNTLLCVFQFTAVTVRADQSFFPTGIPGFQRTMVHDTEPVDIMREPSIVTAQRNSTCALRHLIVISLARWQTCNSTASGGGYVL